MPTTAPAGYTSPSSRTAPVAVDSAMTWQRACLNCGTALVGPFCAECGQRAVPPNPSLRELAGDAFVEFSGWDGKFAETFRTILFRPGKLTLEFLEGRRARYITPVRLYLVASLVYFALAAATPQTRTSKVNIGAVGGKAIAISTQTADPDPNLDPGSPNAKDAEAAIAAVPPIFQPIIRRSIADQAGFWQDLFNSLPKALFVLLPVFAGILKLLYPARRYAEHLYYALHVHAFGFLAFTLSALGKFTHSVPIEMAIAVVILVGVPIYWHRALRRVYGGSLGVTLIKETVIGLLYGAASIPVLIGLAMWITARR